MKLLNFKADEKDIEIWRATAKEHRKTLSRWIRDILNEHGVGSTVPVPRVVDSRPTRTAPAPLKKKAEVLAGELLARAKAKTSGPCAKRLPKGAYCKACGNIH